MRFVVVLVPVVISVVVLVHANIYGSKYDTNIGGSKRKKKTGDYCCCLYR